jgi:DNA-binding GntR family transcriptional regulator
MNDLAAPGKDRDTWSNLNYTFHRRMNEFSGRRHHVRLVIQVLNLVEPYSRIYAHVLGSLVDSQRRHNEMVSALKERDANRLRGLVETSLRLTRERLVNSMQAADDGPDPLEVLLDRPTSNR